MVVEWGSYSGYISALMFCAFLLCDFKQYSIRDSTQCTCLLKSNSRHVSLQTYIVAVGRCFLWRMRTLHNAFAHRSSTPNRSTLHFSDFTFTCIGVFCTSDYNRKRQST